MGETKAVSFQIIAADGQPNWSAALERLAAA